MDGAELGKEGAGFGDKRAVWFGNNGTRPTVDGDPGGSGSPLMGGSSRLSEDISFMSCFVM